MIENLLPAAHPSPLSEREREGEPQTGQYKQMSCGIWIPQTPRSVHQQQEQDQQSAEALHPDQPDLHDREGWKRYWQERGQPWRREPEIPRQRQEELEQRREVPADVKQGIYPFGGMALTRVDIEWLLSTHEGGRGPIDWSDEQQRGRRGLDLRGAQVREETDLRALPLAKIQGGLSWGEWREATEEQLERAGFYFQKVDLTGAHLEGSCLGGAHLEGASLREASLKWALLTEAHLERADFFRVHLEGANLAGAHLERADLTGAHLEDTYLVGAHLERALLTEAHLEQADLAGVVLAEADGVGPSLADVRYGVVSLSVVDWSPVQMLGDEHTARQNITPIGMKKDLEERQQDYQAAFRATHQLAVALQEQGLTEEAARFAYRTKCLKRMELWYTLLLAITVKRRFQVGWPLLFSWALFLLAGYGYRLRRCLFWYVGIVLLFTFLYWLLDPVHFPWWAALAESVNVFHGRGAAPQITELACPMWFSLFTVIEAMIGLVIEIVFVATVIQRLFGK